MYAKHLDTLRGMTKPSDGMSPRHDRKTTSNRFRLGFVHPRQLTRTDTKGMFLRAIVKIDEFFIKISSNPLLEKTRARDYSVSK